MAHHQAPEQVLVQSSADADRDGVHLCGTDKPPAALTLIMTLLMILMMTLTLATAIAQPALPHGPAGRFVLPSPRVRVRMGMEIAKG